MSRCDKHGMAGKQKRYQPTKTHLVVLKRPLPELEHNDPVRVNNNSSWKMKGKIVKKLTSPPRSHLKLNEIGTVLRRNRKYFSNVKTVLISKMTVVTKMICKQILTKINVNIPITITDTKNTGLAQGKTTSTLR